MASLTNIEDLAALRGVLAELDPQGRLASLDMKRVTISERAHLQVAEALCEVLPAQTKQDPAQICLITDETPIMRDGELLLDVVMAQLAPDFRVTHKKLTADHGGLHADEKALDQAALAASGADAIVTIGSGTITDIGKVASQRNDFIPQVALQTAASVDGFTDNVSVILKHGVKRTVPSAWPAIVLSDVVTINGAPREMNSGGFGEALSLFTAPADWYLSHVLGLDQSFHPASMAMLRAASAEAPDWSAGLARGEREATAKLTRLLALRGLVSGVSNTTACLSGVEHVISHMLDLHHAARHQPIGLHGEQVGVASIIAARLWRQAIDEDLLSVTNLPQPDMTKMQARVLAAFQHLDRDGKLAQECWRDCEAKLIGLQNNWQKLEDLTQNWKVRKYEFDPLVTDAGTLAKALQISGAATKFKALRQSVDDELALWAVQNCHLMRNRFNLVDLLDLLGLWAPERIRFAMRDLIGGSHDET